MATTESWWGDDSDLRRQARELIPLLHQMHSQNDQFLLGILHEIGVSGFELCTVASNKVHECENHAAWEGRLIVQEMRTP